MSAHQTAKTAFGKRAEFIVPDRPFLRAANVPIVWQPSGEVDDADYEVISEADVMDFINDNLKRGADNAPKTEKRFVEFAGALTELIEDWLGMVPLKGFLGIAAVLFVSLFIGIYLAGVPASADIYRGPGGLSITDVVQSPIDSNGLRIMELSGKVENRSSAATSLPAIVAEIHNAGGTISRAAISLGDVPLESGQTAGFSIRVPYPGGKNPKVTISFATKGD